MENTEIILPEYSETPAFEHTSATAHEWLLTSKWAKFFAIYGFIYIGITVLGILYLFVQVLPLISSGMFMLPPTMLWGFGILFVIVVFGLVSMFLGSRRHLRFAQNIKQAVANSDQAQLTSAWRDMKGAWKVFGIYTIIMLGFYFILLTLMGYAMKNLPYF